MASLLFINRVTYMFNGQLAYRPRSFRATHVKTTWPTPGGRFLIRKLNNEYGWWRVYSTGENARYKRDFQNFGLAIHYATMMAYAARRFPTKDGTHNKVARHMVLKKLHKNPVLQAKWGVDMLVNEYRHI